MVRLVKPDTTGDALAPQPVGLAPPAPPTDGSAKEASDSAFDYIADKPPQSMNGYPMAIVALVVAGLSIWAFLEPAGQGLLARVPPLALLLAALAVMKGLYVVYPNQGALISLFGAYRGTDRTAGLRWTNPFCRVLKESLRSRSFISEKLKVNDKQGNPIEIAAAIVWRVTDLAKASYSVEDYRSFVEVQCEVAIRYVASAYSYDHSDDCGSEAEEVTLRSGVFQIGSALTRILQKRFEDVGIDVEEAKLTHLAYAPEIAGVMLRRQQAEAIIAARQKIVTGAVSMVEMALHALTEHELVELDDERKAAMVSNLMVVLCAESDVKPIVNVGTLYS